MALQIRLVHALANEVLELPVRSVEQPLVIGRSDKADVHIPSANTAMRHCLLFVHGGNWILQDAGSPGGTLLNGAPVTVPARLKSGDMITLAGEANPPVLIVDPQNRGMGTEAGAAPVVVEDAVVQPPPIPVAAEAPVVVAPVAPTARPAFPTPPDVTEPVVEETTTPAPADEPAAADSQASADDEREADDAHPDETLDIPAAFAEVAPTAADLITASTVARKVKTRSTGLSPTAIAGTAIAGLVILILALWIIHDKIAANSEAELAAKAKPPLEITEPDHRQLPTIFSSKLAAPPVAPQPRPDPVRPPSDATPAVTPAPPQPPVPAGPVNPEDDPRRQTAEWRAVEAARIDPDPVHALVVYDNYLKENPDTAFKGDVTAYIDEAMDRLWLNRIVDLCKQRSQARSDIASLATQIREETDAAYKKQLLGHKTDAEDKLRAANEELASDFKYKGADVPTITDPAVKKTLLDARNPGEYEKWKKAAYRRIVSSHGTKLPWS